MATAMVIVVMGVCGVGKTTVGKALAEKLSCPFEDADNHHSTDNVEKMRQGIPLTDQDRLPWLLSLHKTLCKWLEEEHEDDSDGEIKTKGEGGGGGEGRKNGGGREVGGVLACSALKRSYRSILSGRGGGGGGIRGKECEGEGGKHETDGRRKEGEKITVKDIPNSLYCTTDISYKTLFIHLDGLTETIKSRMESRHDHYMPPSLLETQLATLEPPTHPDEFCLRCNIEESVNNIVDTIINKI